MSKHPRSRTFPHLAIWLPAVLLLFGQSAPAQDIPADALPRIVGPVSDGTPPPPAPERVEPDYTVLETAVRQQGGRTVTIQKVEPPPPASRSTEPASPTPPPDLSDPEFRARIAELQAQAAAEFVPTTLVPLDVTVYDHEFTFLRWTHRKENGEAVGYAVWSNIDFNHLCGFAEIEVGNAESRRRFALLTGLGNIDTARMASNPALQAQVPDLAAVRRLLAASAAQTLPMTNDQSTNPPAFVLVEGDPSDAGAMALIQGLHDLYAREKDRLVAAYEGRERARKEREAYLEAHPPKPKDIVIRYWLKQ